MPNTLLKCDTCGKNIFKNERSLSEHKRFHHGKSKKKYASQKGKGPVDLRIYPMKSDKEVINNHLDNHKDRFEDEEWKELKRKNQEFDGSDPRVKRKPPKGKEKATPKPPPPPRLFKEPTIKCRKCGERFANDRELVTHEAEQHPTCVECREQFPDRDAFNKHSHPKCKVCFKTMLNEQVLNDHMDTHPKCMYCEMSFVNIAQRQIHIDFTHGRQPSRSRSRSPRSPLHSRSQSPSSRSQSHSRSRSQSPSSRPELSLEVDSDTGDFSPASDDDEQSFDQDDEQSLDSIDQDDEELSDASTVIAGREVVPWEPTDNVPPPPPDPQSDDDTISLLDVSDIPSSQQKKCPICYRKFASQAILEEHLREDHKERSKAKIVKRLKKNKLYPCHLCDDQFRSRARLNDHVRTHATNDGEVAGPSDWKPTTKVYQCKICKDILKTEEGYLRHMSDHHTKYDCTVCAARFDDITARDVHMSLEHPKCMICNIAFFSIEEYERHKLEQHQEDRRYDGQLPSETEDEMSDGEEDVDLEDRQFRKHINCVSVDQFMLIHELIMSNQFDTLANDPDLLDSLQIIFKGVLKGYIPLCSPQRLILTREMKKLLVSYGANASTILLMRKKKTLKHLFKVLWPSVELVVKEFSKYGLGTRE